MSWPAGAGDAHVPYRHPPVTYRHYTLTVCPAGPWWWLHLMEGTAQAAPPARLCRTEEAGLQEMRHRCDMVLGTTSLQPVDGWYPSGDISLSIALRRLDLRSMIDG